MKNDFNGRRDESKKDKFIKPKQSKTVFKKERNSFKQRSKQQLKNYVENNFEDDDFEDNFMR